MTDAAKAIRTLADEGAWFSSGEAARRAGVSRQAVHRHLKRMVEAGVLVSEGQGPARRYALPQAWEATYAPAGLDEDRVFHELESSGLLAGSSDTMHAVIRYAITEMVNNAIDHAESTVVVVRVERRGDRVSFDVMDDGVGVYTRLQRAFGFADELEAVQALSKGKLTTAPERHTGEGIFFTSKAVSSFRLESGTLVWMVDNERGESALAECPTRDGTWVHGEVAPNVRSLQELFQEYTHDFAFDVTRTTVKLFEYGTQFVSRSEAKRLVQGLERFQEVIVDFAGVEGVGQGFADELFRVWRNAHAAIHLVPVNMNRVVEFMVQRARSES